MGVVLRFSQKHTCLEQTESFFGSFDLSSPRQWRVEVVFILDCLPAPEQTLHNATANGKVLKCMLEVTCYNAYMLEYML